MSLGRMGRPALWATVALAVGLLPGCKKRPQDHLQDARMAIFEKDPSRALKEYRLALDVLEQDDSPEAQVMRARALKGAADVYYLELRDVRQAIAVYKELVAQCPESPEALEAHITLADLLRNRVHDLRGAISELTAALARNPPQGAELSYQVAGIYFELGDYQQCDLEAQKVISRFETSNYVDDAMFLRGQALAMQDHTKLEAQKVFEELAHRFPDSELAPHALYELGKLKAEAGENEQAIAIWVQALKNHPDPNVVQASIARVRARIANTTPMGKPGDHAAAFDHLKQQPPPKNSLEAAGASAEEAAHEVGGD